MLVMSHRKTKFGVRTWNEGELDELMSGNRDVNAQRESIEELKVVYSINSHIYAPNGTLIRLR